MSSPKSLILKTLLLVWLITINSLSQLPVFAAFMPLKQRLHGLQAYQLSERQDLCVNPCGPYGQLCCDLDQVCYTDSSGNGQCSQTSALSAAPSTVASSAVDGLTPSTSSASYTVITVTPPPDSITSVSAVSSPTSLPTSASTQSASNSAGMKSDNNGLSTGAKVGTAIGVVAAIVAIVFGIVGWTRRSWWRSSPSTGPPTKTRRRPDRTGIVLTNYP
jgi:hypothetical protein